MSATWFMTPMPPSRFAIENEMRTAFWKAGFGDMWISCTKEEVPYECQGLWEGKQFTLEWEPNTYAVLKMAEPNDDLLKAMERVLKHRALVAYKDAAGTVVVEWRARNVDARMKELESAGVAELERLT